MRNRPIIALIDMDCFYVQVELNGAPSYKGQPSAVVQYNSWRGGSIIAVSYEARDKGISRGMRGDEAKQKCPGIHLFSVPENRNKADLTRYRSAGEDVIKCLSSHGGVIEKASVDEAYIDLTDEVDNLLIAASDHEDVQAFWRREKHSIEGCHSVGYTSYDLWLDHVLEMREIDEYCDEVRLALASYLVKKMRDDVYSTLGYRCSAGIAHSKVTAKYACGVHKPNQQTSVSFNHVPTLLQNAPIHKIRNLGGKQGKVIQERLNVETMGQLSCFSMQQLTEVFGDNTGSWLYSLCRGEDDEGVVARQLTQSIGCSKNFPGSSQLDTVEKVRHWLSEMAQEIVERIERDRSTNERVPSHLCVNYRQLRSDLSSGNKKSMAGSRVVPLGRISAEEITTAALVVLAGINIAGHKNMPEQVWHPPLLALGLSAGKFKAKVAKNDISRYLIDSSMHISASFSVSANHSITNTEFNQSEQELYAIQDQSTTLEDDITASVISNNESINEIQDKLSVKKEKIITSLEQPPRRGFFARRLEQEDKDRQAIQNNISGGTDLSRICQGLETHNINNVEQWSPENIMGSTEIIIEEKKGSTSMDVDIEKAEVVSGLGTGKGKGFFAKRIEVERSRKEMEVCPSMIGLIDPGLAESAVIGKRTEVEMENIVLAPGGITASDYMKCEVCSKLILMWYFPEHEEEHLMRELKKEMYREYMDAEATKRQALLAQKTAQTPQSQKNIKSNQGRQATKRKPEESYKTIDSFFRK